MTPIEYVISKLDENDNRIQWWNNIRVYIQCRRYGYAIARLRDHNGDTDYDEQCLVVAKEIVETL